MSRAVEERIAGPARRQHGVVTRRQLAEAGLRPWVIDRLMATGRLQALHRGVFLALPIALPHTREMAAVLAAGADAVLSHVSACVLWECRDRWNGDVDVSSATSRGRCPGIRLHRVEPIPRDERTCKEGIPVTTPARTILDTAALLDSRGLEAVIARAERQGLLVERELVTLVERSRGRRGGRALRALLQAPGGPALTRSEAEGRFLALVREAGLPAPECNVNLGRYEIDFLWRRARIAVEIDGFRYHATRPRFERDRRKDADLLANGVQVLRLSWRQITDEALATVVQLGRALALAGARRGG